VLVLTVTAAFTSAGSLRASDAHYGPGTTLESLVVAGSTYQNVQIRSVTAHTVVFTHRGGMASIHLRDLPKDLQICFGYQAAADVETPPPPTKPAAPLPRRVGPTDTDTTLKALLLPSGPTPELRPEVDLRPQFFELELNVKNQGRRPSCAIFAIVCALEYQNARLKGHAEAFSEEYLSWATRKISRRILSVDSNDPTAASTTDDADEGFTLAEVVAALNEYGIPRQSLMPNTFGHAISTITEPSPALIEEARHHQKIAVYGVRGTENSQRISSFIRILNAGMPIAMGMAWPHFRTVRNAYLSKQTPPEDGGHAVTLVGYRSPDGRLENTEFIFKNSWGADWGRGGYGIVTYQYLEKHLHDAVLLVVEENVSAAH
jgi:hypothetical protein